MTRFHRHKIIAILMKKRSKTILIILLTLCVIKFGHRTNKIDKNQELLTSISMQLVASKGHQISTEFERFYLNVSSEKLMDPLIHKHQYQTLLHIGKECKRKNNIILVLIYSATTKSDGRQIIRNTFGTITNFANRDIEYIFVLGQTTNDTLQRKIEKESVRYLDIIQGNFIDSYKNLTYKRVFSLFWVYEFCKNASYVIKIDDDITINIPILILYLNNKHNKNVTNVLECNIVSGARPYRDPKNKWHTPHSEYPFPTFPPYCAGPSSIMSINVIRQMYKGTAVVPFFWLEDVYGGGFIPWVLNIEIVKRCVFIKDVHQSINEHPCHLFYINNLKKASDSYKMWKTIETSIKLRQNHTCMC
ncbi:Hypothetical predicted protein [Mytilus galloprovincialis]|uniref:Hexosyltransferase n=1 Tax=Mytilus galloprovincialis TaxID=29158 RepID=A0A8B6DV95_MYTGA|nr:Hypothetical predicted protein [Mytilus galloprovincialis]